MADVLSFDRESIGLIAIDQLLDCLEDDMVAVGEFHLWWRTDAAVVDEDEVGVLFVNDPIAYYAGAGIDT